MTELPDRLATAIHRGARPIKRGDLDVMEQVLPLIFGAFGDLTWQVADLRKDAPETYTEVLRVLGVTSARQVGKKLARVRDVSIGNYQVNQVGEPLRDGALWKVKRVS